MKKTVNVLKGQRLGLLQFSIDVHALNAFNQL
jgi:hypothetical protein